MMTRGELEAKLDFHLEEMAAWAEGRKSYTSAAENAQEVTKHAAAVQAYQALLGPTARDGSIETLLREIGPVGLEPQFTEADRREIARTILDCYLLGIGWLTRDGDSGAFQRRDPLLIEVRDRRVADG